MRDMLLLYRVQRIVRSTTHLDLIRTRLECALDLLLVCARQFSNTFLGLLQTEGLLLNLCDEGTGVLLEGDDAFLLAREIRL